MSRSLLVAQREYVEHLRTKTFWLGILVAPVGMVIFYAVMFLLADSRDQRSYAVLDHSPNQWLSQAIDKEAKGDNWHSLVESLPDLPEENVLKQWCQKLQEAFPNLDLKELPTSPDDLKSADLPNKLDLENVDEAALKRLQDFSVNNKTEVGQAVQDFAASSNFSRHSYPDQGEDNEQHLDQLLKDEKIFAYFIIGQNPLESSEGSKYVCNNLTDFSLREWYQGKATKLIQQKHIANLKAEKDLTDDEVTNLQKKFEFIQQDSQKVEVQKKDTVHKFAPVVFVYILWMTIFIAAQMLLTNTVEEKSNRIIEVLLSSVSPSQLMNGKILGIAASGLTIVGFWALFAYLGITILPSFLPSIGSHIAEWGLQQIISDPLYVGSFLGYFLAGYLLYAAILVAIGSVCNSLKESQNLMQPVIFIMMVPLATMIPIVSDPNGTVAKVMTYIPLYTPFAMMNRAGGPPEVWEYLASSALLLFTLWLAFRAAAKIFRVGVLMTGKPPRLGEIWRWLKAP